MSRISGNTAPSAADGMLRRLNFSWENFYAAEIVRLVVALPAFDFASLNRSEAVEQLERRCRLLFEEDGGR